MTRVKWDQPGERLYEAGTDRGMLYEPGGTGVVWNGIVGVDELVNSSITPIHFDGVKIDDIVSVGDFAATLRAFTYPEEFLRYEGMLEDQTGVFLDDQPPQRFHLAYRTLEGNDLNPLGSSYKIHILYNLTALVSQRSYTTVGDDPSAMEFQWDLTGIPENAGGNRPTVHLILDQKKLPDQLVSDIEDILYGTEETDPALPSLNALLSYIRAWDRLIITDNQDGTWTAFAREEGVIVMLDDTTFEINSDTAIYSDEYTYTISSSNKNEDDLWPL